MITWQGPPTFAERFSQLARVMRLAFAFGALMLAFVCILNIGAMAIWQERARIVLYPLFLSWVFVGMLAYQGASAAWPEERLKLMFEVTAVFVLISPLIYVSLVHWQRPVLIVQGMAAHALRAPFS